jgi:hypothetical protein
LTPTGRNQEIRLTYTVPDARGAESNVAILVGGLVNRSFPDQVGTNTVTVTTPNNDQAFPIELRVCNEKAPAGCTLSGAKPAQSYGPLGQEHLGDPTVTGTNGHIIDFVVSARGNGRPATLDVTVRGPGGTLMTQTRPVPAGTVTEGFTVDTGGYDVSVTITATIADAGRGSGQRSTSARSAPPPPPQVIVGRGAACLDGDADTGNDCQRGVGDIWGPCTEAACSKLVIHPVDWQSPNVVCRITRAGESRFAFIGERDTLPSNQPTQVSWFTNGSDIEITCDGGGRTASGGVTW